MVVGQLRVEKFKPALPEVPDQVHKRNLARVGPAHGRAAEHGLAAKGPAQLKPGETLKSDTSIFEVVAFGVVIPTNRIEADGQGKSVPMEFFSTAGRRLSETDLKAIGLRKWETTEYLNSYEHFPQLRILLGSKQQPPGYYSMVGLFDARTKRSLTLGSSYSQVSSNDFGRLGVEPHAWHATPMELVVDVQLDGRVVIETNLVADMTIPVPGGMVKVLGLWEGESKSWSSRGQGNGMPSTIEMRLANREGERNSVLAYACEPAGLAVHVKGLDAKGKVINERGGYGGGIIRSMGLKALPPDVRQLRLTVFTNHHRVVIPLPPVPSLSAGNLPVANLFDVHVPLAQFRGEYELRQFIGEVTQMNFAYPPGGDTMPTNLFPLTVTNTTPALLLVEYRRQLTNGCTVVVDEVKQEIHVEPTQAEKIRRWMKQNLHL